MKLKSLATGLLACFTSTTLLYADFDTDSYGNEEMVQPEEKVAGPFKIEANYDGAAKADFRESALEGQNLRFATGSIAGSFVFYYNPCYKEGAVVALGYVDTLIDWNHNPFFDQDRFHTARVALGGFSERVKRWNWQAQVAVNINTDHWNLADYSTYDLLLWGRYQWLCNPDIGLHIGFLAETGMKIDRIYPIVGFDWKINSCWKINAIFPINFSVVYNWTNNLALSVGSRFFDVRYRAGKDQPLPMALVEYRSVGAEAGVTYTYAPWFNANLHAGYILGGSLKISDRHHMHGRHFKFRSSAYVGGEVDVKF